MGGRAVAAVCGDDDGLSDDDDVEKREECRRW